MKHSSNQELMINRTVISNNILAPQKQIIFIDSQVEDYQFLAAGVLPGIETVILDRNRDGIEQITEVLTQKSNFAAIHIVSHGSPGGIYLGNSQLNLDTLNQYASELKTWFNIPPLSRGVRGDLDSLNQGVRGDLDSLNQGVRGDLDSLNQGVRGDLDSLNQGVRGDLDSLNQGVRGDLDSLNQGVRGDLDSLNQGVRGDLDSLNQGVRGDLDSLNQGVRGHILIYGCNVASGDAGEEFITKLSNLTNSEIAASTTRIGNADKGGNWELDLNTSDFAYSSGIISRQVRLEYTGILANETIDDSNSETIAVGGSTTKTFNITQELDVTDVTFGLNAEHTWRGDIEVILTSPQGTSVTLIAADAGDSDDHFDLLLQDGSGNSFRTGENENTAAPIYGADLTAAPSNPFSAFAGESSIGNWTLTLNNTNVSGNNRSLTYNSSQLNIEGNPPPLDYGDAPDTLPGSASAPDNTNPPDYLTTEADGGASHELDEDLPITIGSTVDGDDGTAQDPDATVDDATDGDDEDGVFLEGTTNSFNGADLEIAAGDNYSVDVVVNDGVVTPPPRVAATVSGTVFNDYDNDGTQETDNAASEVGLAGITVTAYNNAGEEVATSTTDASGAYTLNNPLGEPLRVEFTDLPEGFFASAVSGGDANAVETVFFADGTSDQTANLGLIEENRYVDSSVSPTLIVPCYVYTPVATGDEAAIVTVLHSEAGFVEDVTEKTTIATIDQVGAVYGLAQNKETQDIFVGAFQKRFSNVGPEGNDAIYRIKNDGTVEPFINLDDFFGTDSAGVYSHDPTNFGNDAPAFDAVGKVAFGDVEISEDRQHIWTINLADRKLYKLEVGDGSTHTAGDGRERVAYDILGDNNTTPTNGGIPLGDLGADATNNARPFGLGMKDGLVYVGLVNSAQTTGNVNDLQAYVYSFDPENPSGGFDQVINFPLNYQREFKDSKSETSAQWAPWVTNYEDFELNEFETQPILSDITFDNNGDMMIGLRDRTGDQGGLLSDDTNPDNGVQTAQVQTSGDILRASLTGNNQWTIENSVTDTDTDNSTNPEFYDDDFAMEVGDGGRLLFEGNYIDKDGGHDETAQGSVVQIPGYSSVESTAMDPVKTFLSGGIIGLDNTTGNKTRGIELYVSNFDRNSSDPNFGKASGLGDLEYAGDVAPIEIGNRVWQDLDQDGIQDAGEAGIEGVTVSLYSADGSTLLATTTTDAKGEYYFNQDNVIESGAAGLEPDTDYQILLDNTADFADGGALNGFDLTVQDANSNANDTTDSDAIDDDDTPTINVTTGDYGENDYSHDVGFKKNITLVGWIDFNRDGIFSDNEAVTLDTDGGLNTDGVTANTLEFTAPADVKSGLTAARFRVASGLTGDNLSTTTPNGAAPNGEVEDYVVNLLEEPPLDYGDAPDSLSGAVSAADNLANNGNDLPDYQTTEANEGASHTQDPDCPITIGDTVDGDDGTQQNATATEDDTDADGDDEDGVFLEGTTNSLNGADLEIAAGDNYSVDVVVNDGVVTPPPTGVAATVSGTVYNDYDNDGTQETDNAASEVGLAGITVTAYNNAGEEVATSTTDASGAYTLNNPLGEPLRVEFTDLPEGFSASAVSGGDANAVETVFFADGTSNQTANLGLIEENRYVDSSVSPTLIVPCYVYTPVATGDEAAIVAVLHSEAGFVENVTEKTTIATIDQVGAVYGLAQNKETQDIFVGAFQKRLSDIGPEGNDAIYRIKNDGTVEPFINLDDFFGANSAGVYSHDPNNFVNDAPAFDAVGKVAFGDVEISEDRQHIWTINLADRKLYKLEVGDGSTHTAGDGRERVAYDILGDNNTTPTNGGIPLGDLGADATNNARPFGLGMKDGLVYVGLVNSAQTTGNVNDLQAYVYSFDPENPSGGFDQVINFPLNYQREFKDSKSETSAQWAPWVTNYEDFELNEFETQPILSDITFDNNGDMMIGLRDRTGDQGGFLSDDTDPDNVSEQDQIQTSGDILRASLTGNNQWTIENSVTDTDTDNSTNPEFYDGDDFATNPDEGGRIQFNGTYFPTDGGHDESAQGSVVQIPGYSSVESTAYDPFETLLSGGIIGLDNTTGNKTRGIELYASNFDRDSPDPNFSKANGLGDLEYAGDVAPIEIGNRVWQDLDQDGIQDAGEAGIEGVTVSLYSADGSTRLATTTTDAKGEYYFNQDNVNQNDAAGLEPDTDYQILLDNTADFADGGALNGFDLTVQDANSNANDTTDSDAIDDDGTPTINVTTGDYGENDYSHDVGFKKNITLVGWIDFNRDGIFSDNEAVTLDTDGGLNTDGVTANTLEFSVPENVAQGPTAARFRVASGLTGDNLSTTTPNGAAPNGEVEDYVVNLIQTNQPPTLDLDGDDSSNITGNDFATNYLVGGDPVSIADDVLIGDPDDFNLQSASIHLTIRADGDAAESLVINGTLPSGISASAYDSVTGVMTLTGDAPIADYQNAIAQIEYTNTIGYHPSDRMVEVTVNDGLADSNIAMTTISFDYPPSIDLDGDDSSFI